MSRHVSTAVLQRLGAFGRIHAVQYIPIATQTSTLAWSCSPPAAVALCDTATAAAVHAPTTAHGTLAGDAAHMASEICATSAACGASPPQPHATSAPAMSARAVSQALLPLVFTRGARTQPKLPVVLATRLEGVGEPGDVVRVSAGYARNLLIPYRLAYPATDSYISAIKIAKEEGLLDSTSAPDTGAAAEPQQQQQQQQQQEQQAAAAELTLEQKVKEAEEVARRLETLKLSIKRNVARRSSELREPIELAEILSEVRRQFSIELAPANVQLQEPLKAIGTFEIPLRFPSKVPLPGGKEQIALRVNVRRK